MSTRALQTARSALPPASLAEMREPWVSLTRGAQLCCRGLEDIAHVEPWRLRPLQAEAHVPERAHVASVRVGAERGPERLVLVSGEGPRLPLRRDARGEPPRGHLIPYQRPQRLQLSALIPG